MDEKLVYVGKIIALEPIPGADFIVAATVVCGDGGKWRGVVKKADFEVGSRCIVYLPDSILPESESMKFMEATGWRVKMRRFRGAASEVVIMPSELVISIGKDVTNLFGVKKYFKPIPASLAGKAKGNFPGFIRKTDEPNYQRSQNLIDKLMGKPYYITEKADGSSSTAYRWKGVFGVCSRNLELEESTENGYWEIANRYNLKETLPEGYAIQWETCGPKIQSNPMGFNKIEGFAFSVWDISNQRYLEFDEFITFCKKLGFPTVKILFSGDIYINIDLSKTAKGKYENGNEREGIVVRSWHLIDGEIISFKAINLDYKD